MKNRPIYYLKNYFSLPANWSTVIMTLITSCALYLFRNSNIKMWILGLVSLVLLLIIWYLFIRINQVREYVSEHNTISLEISRFVGSDNGNTIMILEPNEILSLDVIVVVYYISNHIEKKIATGRVSNIQQKNKLQQIDITEWSTDETVKTELLHNNIDYIDKVIVKPMFVKYGGYSNE